jgi:hypothetical protein
MEEDDLEGPMLGMLLTALWRLVVALAPSLLSRRWWRGPPYRSWAKVRVEPRPLVVTLPACRIATSAGERLASRSRHTKLNLLVLLV